MHHEKHYRGFIVRVVCRVFTEKPLLYGRSMVVGLTLRGGVRLLGRYFGQKICQADCSLIRSNTVYMYIEILE